MDLGLTALVVLGTFATVHERLLELIRRTFLGPAEYTDLQAIKDGYGRGFFRLTPQPGKEKPLAATDTLVAAPPSPGLIRRFARPYRWRRLRKLVDGLTIGPWAALVAVALAFATRADAIALFRRARPGEASSDVLFFSLYLGGWQGIELWKPWTWDIEARRAALGCLLMGFSTALGSRFWHDLSKGLIDWRANARQLPQEARDALPKDSKPDAEAKPDPEVAA
jgi:hypothetical protein